MSLTSSDQAFEWDGYILLVFQRRFSRLEAVVRQLLCSTGYVPIIRAHFQSETRDDPLMYRARFDPLHQAASAVDIYYQSLNASPPVSCALPQYLSSPMQDAGLKQKRPASRQAAH